MIETEFCLILDVDLSWNQIFEIVWDDRFEIDDNFLNRCDRSIGISVGVYRSFTFSAMLNIFHLRSLMTTIDNIFSHIVFFLFGNQTVSFSFHSHSIQPSKLDVASIDFSRKISFSFVSLVRRAKFIFRIFSRNTLNGRMCSSGLIQDVNKFSMIWWMRTDGKFGK